MQMLADNLCKSFLFKPQRHFVKRRSGQVLDNVLLSHVAEMRYLFFHFVGYFHLAAQHQNIRLNADRKQLLYRVLGRLAL